MLLTSEDITAAVHIHQTLIHSMHTGNLSIPGRVSSTEEAGPNKTSKAPAVMELTL